MHTSSTPTNISDMHAHHLPNHQYYIYTCTPPPHPPILHIHMHTSSTPTNITYTHAHLLHTHQYIRYACTLSPHPPILHHIPKHTTSPPTNITDLYAPSTITWMHGHPPPRPPLHTPDVCVYNVCADIMYVYMMYAFICILNKSFYK